MGRNRYRIVSSVLSACVLVVLNTPFVLAQDVEGSKDHPMIKRYPGSVITNYVQKDFDEYLLVLGNMGRDFKEAKTKTKPLEGKLTRITYRAPEGRSVLEVYRNYEQALQKAGFQTLFTCNSQETCGWGSFKFNPEREDWWTDGGPVRHISAKLARPEGDVYVSLHVQGAPEINLDIIEMKPMQTGLVTVDAAAMAGDISRAGHVAIYGIYFDTGKADLKPESEPALKEIVKLLQQNSGLKLHVVGHTDSVGDLKSNMDLSRRRAEAVVKELTTKHGIAAARLRADSVGPLSPVASNKTEDGRAKNRRVELVEQ